MKQNDTTHLWWSAPSELAHVLSSSQTTVSKPFGVIVRFFFFSLYNCSFIQKKKLKTIFNNNSSWQEQNAGWFSSSIDAINSMPAKRSSRRFSSFQLWEITLQSLWSHPLFSDVSHISNACCDVRSKSGNPELTKLSLTKIYIYIYIKSIHMYFKSNLYAVLLTVTVWVWHDLWGNVTMCSKVNQLLAQCGGRWGGDLCLHEILPDAVWTEDLQADEAHRTGPHQRPRPLSTAQTPGWPSS